MLMKKILLVVIAILVIFSFPEQNYAATRSYSNYGYSSIYYSNPLSNAAIYKADTDFNFYISGEYESVKMGLFKISISEYNSYSYITYLEKAAIKTWEIYGKKSREKAVKNSIYND